MPLRSIAHVPSPARAVSAVHRRLSSSASSPNGLWRKAGPDLLGVSIATPENVPGPPVLPDRLRPRFLRAARVVPLAIEPRAGQDRLVVAMADPLDRFHAAAISPATGLDMRVEIGVPIELDAALDRLYPEAEIAADAEDMQPPRKMTPSG